MQFNSPQNVFWSLRSVDIYSALSWDRLHAYHGGLLSDHILVEIKSAIADLPGRAEAGVDAGYDFYLFRLSFTHFCRGQPPGYFSLAGFKQFSVIAQHWRICGWDQV